MMKITTALLAAAGLASGAPMAKLSALPDHEIKAMFHDHMIQYNKAYSSVDEFRVRFENFKINLRRADEQNALNPGATFGVTRFSDLSEAEFKARFLNDKARPTVLPEAPAAGITSMLEFNRVNVSAADGGVDWRPQQGKYVNYIQNQEQCGSCWAFSVTEAVAAANAIAGNGLDVLSVQQLVDCDSSSYGCNGGEPDNAYEYIINAGGVETAANYPYTAVNGQCNFDKSKVAQTISSWKWVSQNENSDDEGVEAMKTAVATQPLSICVAASTWQTYTGGVISTCDDQVDHCVRLDGYTTGDDAHWIVANSWDTTWGEQGYIYVKIGSNLCQIQSTVSAPTV